MAPERYSGRDTHSGLRYTIHLPWFYDFQGIPIGCVIAVIKAGIAEFRCCRGTLEFSRIWEILNAAGFPVAQESPPNKAFLRHFRKHGRPPLAVKKHDSALDTVSALYSASAKGEMNWVLQLNLRRDTYTSEFMGMACSIEFMSPQISSRAEAKNVIARLVVDSAIFDFACGTVGMSLIEEMLSASSPAIRKNLAARRNVQQKILKSGGGSK